MTHRAIETPAGGGGGGGARRFAVWGEKKKRKISKWHNSLEH